MNSCRDGENRLLLSLFVEFRSVITTLEIKLTNFIRQLITSAREEAVLINTTTKPIVKLLINRHNNKYSYTSTSDDNLLKNLELFDKLSLRFSGRVLFIKDVIGSNEICCWSFYGMSYQ